MFEPGAKTSDSGLERRVVPVPRVDVELAGNQVDLVQDVPIPDASHPGRLGDDLTHALELGRIPYPLTDQTRVNNEHVTVR